MQKLLNKFIAVIITLIMVSANMAPAIVYAAESLSQNSKTKEENVEFNATVNNAYNASLDVNTEGSLELSLKVSETGYLKDCVVTLKDNNYEIIDNGNLNVKSINGNVIELDEVNTGKILNVSLPIRLKKEAKVFEDILGKDSTVTLNAIYVNEKGKEKKIEKTLTEHLEWTAEANEIVRQELVRYIKFDNKTMISFKVTEGLEDNIMPVQSKEIIVNVPSLQNNKPSNVIVTGKGISYTYENDVLTIKKENTPDSEGKIVWNSQDEYMVTYIYDAQVESATIESQVVSKVQVKESTVEGRVENYTYELNEEVGKYVEVETAGTAELSKGYMYTNIKNRQNNLETGFEVRVKANVGFKDVVDSIKIVESKEMFNSLDASNYISNKKVKVEKDNLVQILGEEGTIKVLANDGTELGTLTKDNNELNINTREIILETSKVVKEGDLEIILSKAIDSNIPFTKDQITSFTELTTTASVYGYKDENENSSKEVSKVINLTEPTSKAQLDVNHKNLSTVIKNEDVILTATLETNDITDALYSNAKAKIILPDEVKEINIKEARLIYEDELKLNNVVANENTISLNLDGSQTKYSTQSTSNGTVVRIIADITLDNLAPTNEKEVILEYSNEESGEQKNISSPIGIVAPTGFVTTNSLEVDGQKVTSQESNEQVVKINTNSDEKVMNISATVVNNLALDATGVTILGTIPTSGNKDASGADLGSNFDTVLNTAINVSREDVQVYYSENANETVNGESWKTEYTQEAKAFKIVITGIVTHGEVINFGYSVKVPANLEYGKISKASYGVYYNNNAEQGNTQNLVLARAVGVSTGEIPTIELEDSMIETNSESNIANGANVKEGKFITYRLKIKNTGKDVANNVNIDIKLPDGLAIVRTTYEMSDLPSYEYDYETKYLSTILETLNPDETYEIEYKLAVTQILTGTQNEVTEQKISAEVKADKLEESVTSEKTIKIVKGDIISYATSDKTNKSLKVGDTIQYYINIKNANYTSKNNIIAQIKLPSELKVISVVNNEDTKYNYDENSNTITYNKSKLNPGATDGILINLEVLDFKEDKQVKISSTIKCDEMKEEENLEEISYNLTKSIISSTLTSNIPEGNISDTDDLEYYINVKNNSNDNISVNISDNIPSSLRVLGYEIQDANGKRQIETNSKNILVSLTINKEETARITIKTKPYALQKGRVAEIENSATIEKDEISLKTNTLKHKIVGTSQNSAGPSLSPDGTLGDENLDEDIVTKEGTYKISGTVWIDQNENGIKEESEERLSGLTVKLYDKTTGNVALDVDGSELVGTTDDLGRYTFVNVNPGNYITVVEIEGLNYGVAPYKVADVLESENSDFVTTKIDGKEVAATDEIKVENINIYNIDLGLVKNKTFDLDISKTVTRISVANTKSETRTYDQNNLSVAKVELATANVEFATVLVEYTIRIENKGQVSGYAKSIVDYIPEGMTFNSELNSSWYLGQDGNAYNTSLANTLINPGEVKEVMIVLSRKMSSENTGTVRNTAEILMSYNEYGLEDIDANSGKTQDNTDDKSSADVVIGMATGREIASFTGITLGILSILAISIYEIKKHVISKMYNYLERR